MNTRYDEFLYKNLRNILVSEFSCTVPFFPDYVTGQDNQEIEICNTAEKRKDAYKTLFVARLLFLQPFQRLSR